jgi:hypothetical protein
MANGWDREDPMMSAQELALFDNQQPLHPRVIPARRNEQAPPRYQSYQRFTSTYMPLSWIYSLEVWTHKDLEDEEEEERTNVL